uniref:ATP synthase F0 subunit 8 n=1 Tax=Clavisyllis tenjini TaxID=3041283 RepID=UPI002552037E|nr:ATP synthase F0 subunit 8 [Clavisyllis tenjini]WGF21042.1 ATP synthase F0 subunit 8 [Clavisyllis tenjini]
MPHLSPLSWVIIPIIIWLSIILLLISFWFQQNPLFSLCPQMKSNKISFSNWNWL